jgi:hypothetical protein
MERGDDIHHPPNHHKCCLSLELKVVDVLWAHIHHIHHVGR